MRESTMSKLHEQRNGPGSGSSTSTTSPRSTEETTAALEAIAQNQEKIARSQKDVISAVSQLRIELEQAQRSMKQSAGSTSPAASEKRLDEIVARQGKQETAISKLIELLSQTELIQLPNGESATRGELESLRLTRSTNEELRATTAALADVQAEVRKGHVVRLDEEKVAARLSRNLDQSLRDLDSRMETALAAQEARLEGIGQARAAAVAAELTEAARRLERAEDRVRSLQRTITWQGVGRVALALVPFAVVGLVLAGTLGLLGTAFGVGPLLGWAWSSFEAASAWWAKALIAAGALGGASLAVWLVARLGRKVSDAYRGW